MSSGKWLPFCLGPKVWPGDAIWWHGTRSTLAQVMACCLMAPSHYLNQCWLSILEVPWHSSGCIIIRRSEETNQWNKNENCIFIMASTSPRDQWVNCAPTCRITGVSPLLMRKRGFSQIRLRTSSVFPSSIPRRSFTNSWILGPRNVVDSPAGSWGKQRKNVLTKFQYH